MYSWAPGPGPVGWDPGQLGGTGPAGPGPVGPGPVGPPVLLVFAPLLHVQNLHSLASKCLPHTDKQRAETGIVYIIYRRLGG